MCLLPTSAATRSQSRRCCGQWRYFARSGCCSLWQARCAIAQTTMATAEMVGREKEGAGVGTWLGNNNRAEREKERRKKREMNRRFVLGFFSLVFELAGVLVHPQTSGLLLSTGARATPNRTYTLRRVLPTPSLVRPRREATVPATANRQSTAATSSPT